MAFSLIEQSGGLVPITALTKERLSSWLEGAADHEPQLGAVNRLYRRRRQARAGAGR